MRIRGVLSMLLACGLVLVATSAASAQMTEINDPTGAVLGNGGGLQGGPNGSHAFEGGICNHNQSFMPGYYYMYFSPGVPPGGYGSSDDCPAATQVPGSVVPPIGPLPIPGTSSLPLDTGATKHTDSTGTLGPGGGVSTSSTPNREIEAGVCNKTPTMPGYYVVYIGQRGPGGGVEPACSGDAPSVTTLSATNITATSAQLNGKFNAHRVNTYWRYEYGTTDQYGSQSGRHGGNNNYSGSDTAAPWTLTGLQPDTTYHFRLLAWSNAGGTYGSDVTFTTPAS